MQGSFSKNVASRCRTRDHRAWQRRYLRMSASEIAAPSVQPHQSRRTSAIRPDLPGTKSWIVSSMAGTSARRATSKTSSRLPARPSGEHARAATARAACTRADAPSCGPEGSTPTPRPRPAPRACPGATRRPGGSRRRCPRPARASWPRWRRRPRRSPPARESICEGRAARARYASARMRGNEAVPPWITRRYSWLERRTLCCGAWPSSSSMSSFTCW